MSKKRKKQRGSSPVTLKDVLREQIVEAFGVITKPGKWSPAFEVPPDVTVLTGFAETCDALPLFGFEDSKDLLGELLIEALTLQDEKELESGLFSLFDFFRWHPPFYHAKDIYSAEQIAAVQAWLTLLSQRDDRQHTWDMEQLFPLWQLEVPTSQP